MSHKFDSLLFLRIYEDVLVTCGICFSTRSGINPTSDECLATWGHSRFDICWVID